MSEGRDVTAVAELLADDCAQTILAETTTEPKSAEELSEACDVSPQTVYRRLDDLQEYDLVTEELRPDAEGHHYKVYAATLDQVVVDLTPDGLDLRLTRRDRMADRFTHFIEEMREE